MTSKVYVPKTQNNQARVLYSSMHLTSSAMKEKKLFAMNYYMDIGQKFQKTKVDSPTNRVS